MHWSARLGRLGPAGWLVLAAPLSALPGLAAAQSPAPAASALEEVVVTAEKRSARLQDTPLAVSATTGEKLSAERIDTIQALQQTVPSLVVTSNAGLGQPYIRAVGNEILAGSNDSAVATHLDGVYVARGGGLLFDFFDLDRVEVLRGPQGTLYGRNATGGAINVVTRAPSRTAEGEMAVTYGNYDDMRFTGAASVPVIEDRLSVRAAVLVENRDGFQHNLFDGKGLMDKDLTAVRLSARAWSGDWETTLRADYAIDHSTGAATSEISGSPALAPARAFGGVSATRFFDVNVDTPTRQKVENGGGSLTIHGPTALGEVTSLTGYRVSRFSIVLDQDGTQIPALKGDPETQNAHAFSQELQLAGRAGPVSYIVGAYYFHEAVSEFFQFVPGAPFTLAGLQDLVFAARGRTNAEAVFAQADYHVTDALTVTLGGRYGHEKKTAVANNRFNFAALPTARRELDSDSFTPKFGVQYRIAPDVNAYASVTKGFKSGGVNTVATTDEIYGPETLWAYEAGLKADWLGRRLRTNVSAFYYDYRDMQVNKFTPTGTLVENAGSATIKGIELEAEAAPATGLKLDGQLAYLSAEFDHYQTINPEQPAAGVQDLVGYRLPRAPRWSGSVGAQYTFDLGPDFTATLRGEYQYRGSVFYSQYQNPLVGEDSLSLVNAFATLTSRRHGYTVQVWGRNLGDTHWRQFVGSSPGLTGVQAIPAAPRTYGVTLSYAY